MYQQIVDTLLVEKLQHFWVLLRFWFKSYYVSGFTTLLVIYYVSGSNSRPVFDFCVTELLAFDDVRQNIGNNAISLVRELKVDACH